MVRFFKKVKSQWLVVALVAVASTLTIGVGATASASAHGWWHRDPSYVKITKPNSTDLCNGGTWVDHTGGWWWHRHHYKVWVPNWEKNGFESKAQCLKYVTTAAPTSKSDCRQNWWKLGFESKHDCYRYLKLHQGGGYGGDMFTKDESQEDQED